MPIGTVDFLQTTDGKYALVIDMPIGIESPTNTPDIRATLKSSRGVDGNAGAHATARRPMRSRYFG